MQPLYFKKKSDGFTSISYCFSMALKAFKFISNFKIIYFTLKYQNPTIIFRSDLAHSRTYIDLGAIYILVKLFMSKNPISVDKDMLAAKAIGIMNEKKITSLCVHNKSNRKKTIGILHIHNLIDANIT